MVLAPRRQSSAQSATTQTTTRTATTARTRTRIARTAPLKVTRTIAVASAQRALVLTPTSPCKSTAVKPGATKCAHGHTRSGAHRIRNESHHQAQVNTRTTTIHHGLGYCEQQNQRFALVPTIRPYLTAYAQVRLPYKLCTSVQYSSRGIHTTSLALGHERLQPSLIQSLSTSRSCIGCLLFSYILLSMVGCLPRRSSAGVQRTSKRAE